VKLADEWVLTLDKSKAEMLVAEREDCLVYLFVALTVCK